jgi:hypothetical protein
VLYMRLGKYSFLFLITYRRPHSLADTTLRIGLASDCSHHAALDAADAYPHFHLHRRLPSLIDCSLRSCARAQLCAILK